MESLHLNGCWVSVLNMYISTVYYWDAHSRHTLFAYIWKNSQSRLVKKYHFFVRMSPVYNYTQLHLLICKSLTLYWLKDSDRTVSEPSNCRNSAFKNCLFIFLNQLNSLSTLTRTSSTHTRILFWVFNWSIWPFDRVKSSHYTSNMVDLCKKIRVGFKKCRFFQISPFWFTPLVSFIFFIHE